MFISTVPFRGPRSIMRSLSCCEMQRAVWCLFLLLIAAFTSAAMTSTLTSSAHSQWTELQDSSDVFTFSVDVTQANYAPLSSEKSDIFSETVDVAAFTESDNKAEIYIDQHLVAIINNRDVDAESYAMVETESSDFQFRAVLVIILDTMIYAYQELRTHIIGYFELIFAGLFLIYILLRKVVHIPIPRAFNSNGSHKVRTYCGASGSVIEISDARGIRCQGQISQNGTVVHRDGYGILRLNGEPLENADNTPAGKVVCLRVVGGKVETISYEGNQ